MRQTIAESFAQQPLMATLGARLAHVEPGSVHIVMEDAEAVQQQHGFVHGGAVTALADSAAGYSAMTLLEEGMEVLTIELKTNFLRPAKGALRAEGRVIRNGRSVIVAAAEVYDGQRRHVATFLTTIAPVPHPNT